MDKPKKSTVLIIVTAFVVIICSGVLGFVHSIPCQADRWLKGEPCATQVMMRLIRLFL